MKKEYVIIVLLLIMAVLLILRDGDKQKQIEMLQQQINLLHDGITSLKDVTQSLSTRTEENLSLLDGKIDTLESIIDKDKKRKVQINKVVLAIKSQLPYGNTCETTLDSGELLRVAGAVVDMSERYAVPANLVLGVIRQESAFCQKAISPVGAQGYMQLMPETATEVSNTIGVSLNVWSTRDNIHLGVAYLSQLLTIFKGDIGLATKAYNAGPNHVRKVLAGVTKEYHSESLEYSVKVQEYMHAFKLAGVTW